MGSLGSKELKSTLRTVWPSQKLNFSLLSYVKQLHKIYNLPQPVFNEPDPIVVFDMHYIQNFASNIPAPDFTIISPSHNSGEILNFTAPAIFKTTLGIWEIVFLLDACSDGSLETLKRQIMNEFEMSTGWFY